MQFKLKDILKESAELTLKDIPPKSNVNFRDRHNVHGITASASEKDVKEFIENGFNIVIRDYFMDGNWYLNYGQDHKKEYFEVMKKFKDDMVKNFKKYFTIKQDTRYTTPTYDIELKPQYKDQEKNYLDTMKLLKNKFSPELKKSYIDYFKNYAGKTITL